MQTGLAAPPEASPAKVDDAIADRDTEPHKSPLWIRAASRSGTDFVLWAIVAIGIALRMRQWWFDRSLWADEATVGDQILTDSYGRLLHPLAANQGAPWGWLWLEKLTSQLVGQGERELRLVPLLAGCTALILAAFLAKRLLRPLPAALALTALAVVEPLVYYSNDVKQYSTDSAVVAGAFLLTLVVRDRYRAKPLWILVWACLSVAFVLLSQPGVLAVGVSAAVLFLDALVARRIREAVYVVVASIPWIGTFGAEYVIDLHSLHANNALNDFWASGYPPTGAGAGGVLRWLGDDAVHLVGTPIGLSFGVLVLVLFGVGLVRLARAQPPAALFVGLLSLAACVAAIVHVYPLGTRLALYLDVPVLMTVAAAAGPRHTNAAHSSRPTPGWRAMDGGLLLGLSAAMVACIVSPVQAAIRAVRDPYVTVESRPLIKLIESQLQPGDSVFVQGYDMTPAVYYHWKLSFPITGSFSYQGSPGCSSSSAVSTMRSATHRDIWLLFGYPLKVPGGWSTIGDTIKNNEAMLAGLGRIEEVRQAAGPGSAAVLIDPKEPSTLRSVSTAPGCVMASDVTPSGLRQ